MCGMQELDCPLGGISVKGTVLTACAASLEFLLATKGFERNLWSGGTSSRKYK